MTTTHTATWLPDASTAWLHQRLQWREEVQVKPTTTTATHDHGPHGHGATHSRGAPGVAGGSRSNCHG